MFPNKVNIVLQRQSKLLFSDLFSCCIKIWLLTYQKAILLIQMLLFSQLCDTVNCIGGGGAQKQEQAHLLDISAHISE